MSQTGGPIGTIPVHPTVGALPGYPEFFGHMGDAPVIEQAASYQQGAAVKVETSIKVGHGDLRGRES
jgi:hypothetical protein